VRGKVAAACRKTPMDATERTSRHAEPTTSVWHSVHQLYTLALCLSLNNHVIGMCRVLPPILLALSLLGCDHLTDAVVHEPHSIAKSTIDLVDTAAPGTIEGHVIDAETGEALPGTSVFLPNQEQGTAADREGTFRIENISSGAHQLEARFVGYRTAETSVDLTDGGAQLHITMKVLPVEERGDVIVLRCFAPDSTAERE